MGECTVLCVATAQKNEKKHVSRNRAEPLIQLVTVASPGPTPASNVYWGSTHWTATRPKKTPQKARVRRSARYLSMGVPVENSTGLLAHRGGGGKARARFCQAIPEQARRVSGADREKRHCSDLLRPIFHADGHTTAP